MDDSFLEYSIFLISTPNYFLSIERIFNSFINSLISGSELGF